MMSQSRSFSILVNSSDGFEDCWAPFFTLFSRYWPSCDVPILLNTESKLWGFPSLRIRCTRIQELSGATRRLTWSECLLGALEQVPTPIVLYMHEDYFIERPVQIQLIKELANRMVEEPEICHIGLTHFGSEGPFRPWHDSRLWQIDPRARYRISTQAGLWRVDTLRSYLRLEENAWMFEIFGTKRAAKRAELFLTANRDLYNPNCHPIIQYTHTGIVKGKWHPAIPALFKLHGLEINFERRGFFKPKPRIVEKMVTLSRLLVHPAAVWRGLRGV